MSACEKEKDKKQSVIVLNKFSFNISRWFFD